MASQPEDAPSAPGGGPEGQDRTFTAGHRTHIAAIEPRRPALPAKAPREHVLPLKRRAAILDSIPEREGRSLVFGYGKGGYAGWSKSKAELDELVQLKQPGPARPSLQRPHWCWARLAWHRTPPGRC
ncbi:hypothetical protein IVB12_06375 [Bradyrhizobium sp. 179]|uniref:hypothetical protein n=1 Tax=Bradyrhizobium sp. 179 TaxID=2782648 RepID=UPI001FF85FA5|nr:hypothetical protein [Bradyrhizobium sp. 179]MCK1541615.1 hypothetical protein [Bradyrhizobium sp. 179]